MTENRRKTILLVEDEAVLALTEKMALEDKGYVVSTANSGEMAVAAIKSKPDTDLILMDINLGEGIDGTEAAALILKDLEIPIVFLSSHIEPEIVEKTEKITSYGYVVKNSSITVLDASIKMAFKLFSAKIEQQNKEALLHEKEEQYRILHETAGIGIAYYSIEGIVISYNDLAAKHLNGTPEDFIGKSVYMIFPKADADLCLDRIRKSASSEKPVVYEDVVPIPTGEMHFLSTFTRVIGLNGKISGVQIASQDITERVKAEGVLRESELRMKNLVESSPMGIHLYEYSDSKQLIFVGANPSADKILGIDHTRLFGKTIIEAFPSLEGTEVPERYINAAISGKPWKTEQIEYTDNQISGAFEVVAFQTSTNKMAAFFFDITERKQAENEIRALLLEKELILKEMNHRVMNNMNTIVGLLAFQASTLPEPTAKAALEDARGRVQSMIAVFDKLYHSDFQSSSSIRSFLSQMIDEIIGNFPNCSIVKTEKNMDDIDLDAKRLQPLGIIINELLTNIMKYAFAGRDSGLISVSAVTVGSHIIVSLQDNGIGIPESVSFENSNGFGLKLVHALTEQLNGKIWIERGIGTKVVLKFEK